MRLPIICLIFIIFQGLMKVGECGNVIPILIESVVGSTTLHKTQDWKFDPEEGRRLNRDFERQHGHKSEILIEKLGLGIDGHQEERKLQQTIRDMMPIENFIPDHVKHLRG